MRKNDFSQLAKKKTLSKELTTNAKDVGQGITWSFITKLLCFTEGVKHLLAII